MEAKDGPPSVITTAGGETSSPEGIAEDEDEETNEGVEEAENEVAEGAGEGGDRGEGEGEGEGENTNDDDDDGAASGSVVSGREINTGDDSSGRGTMMSSTEWMSSWSVMSEGTGGKYESAERSVAPGVTSSADDCGGRARGVRKSEGSLGVSSDE